MLDNKISKLKCDSFLIISSWSNIDLNHHFFAKIDIWKDSITFGMHNYAISRCGDLSTFKLNNKQSDHDGYYLKIILGSYTIPFGGCTTRYMSIQKVCKKQ